MQPRPIAGVDLRGGHESGMAATHYTSSAPGETVDLELAAQALLCQMSGRCRCPTVSFAFSAS